MKNLLQETIEVIQNHDKSPEDIVFIGSTESGHSCTWEQFNWLADFEYDNGFGGQEIPPDLNIIFSDGSWLERGEYDGSEWWAFKQTPKIPQKQHPIIKLNGRFVDFTSFT